MPDQRVGNCIFCDDARFEVSNKISLMGIYASDMLFAMPPPVMVPKMAIMTWIIADPGDMPSRIALRVTNPEGNEIARMNAGGEGEPPLPPHPGEEGLTKVALRILIPMMNVIITQEGFIDLYVDTERESFRAGHMRIRFNVQIEEPTVSAVSLPPSSQSHGAPQEPSSQPDPSRSAPPTRSQRY